MGWTKADEAAYSDLEARRREHYRRLFDAFETRYPTVPGTVHAHLVPFLMSNGEGLRDFLIDFYRKESGL